MGGVAKSAGGFLGLSDGPKAADGQFGNADLDRMKGQNSIFSDQAGMGYLADYARGGSDANALLGKEEDNQLNGGGNMDQLQGFQNAMATGATTGSRYATDQVQNNGILGGLFGKDGQLNKAESKLDELNNQGFELKPEDHTLYGQTSGNIARMFGAQGNQMSQDLASRGLAAGPSGAAGAMFSGIAGNQNEMLAKAQTQIMNQRVQDTLQKINQQQNFVSQLGAQGASAINQQYGRQLSGAQNQTGNLATASGQQNEINNAQNQYGLQKSQFDADHTPANFMDYYTAGMGKGLQQQGTNATDPMNSGSGSPGSIAGNASKQGSSAMGGGGGGSGMMSMFAMA